MTSFGKRPQNRQFNQFCLSLLFKPLIIFGYRGRSESHSTMDTGSSPTKEVVKQERDALRAELAEVKAK